MSVRPWDHQVRQAILLAAPYEVVAARRSKAFFIAPTNLIRSATMNRNRHVI